jgi:endonuclease/exonuclease/phosphatase family metal-dependent hydrolase
MIRFDFNRTTRFHALLGAAWIIFGAPLAAPAQWNPSVGQWGKSHTTDLRVVTWNIEDGICTSADKSNNFGSWEALARSVALLKPDVLILQEVGDNSGNGTGSGVDSVPALETTLDLFFYGGTDIFRAGNPPVTAYVQLWAPGFEMPYVFVSSLQDGFNRNVILSRYPFADLNGDNVAVRSDIPFVSTDLYAPGGSGGIRGFAFAEIDLPAGTYAGDVVVGNAHLKSGSDASDLADRLAASKNVAYVMDYWFNGAGGATPDPRNKITDLPPNQATMLLGPDTPIIIGGDWNEDEQTNGRKGPAEWLTRAELTGGSDGTDRDRTDATYDSAVNPINGNRSTRGSSKLDYLAWQDSIASPRRQAILNSGTMNSTQMPPEFLGFTLVPGSVSGSAADHRAVLIDFILPLAAPCGSDEDCDDNDACTTGTCVETECVYTAITCDDGDDCTSNTCHSELGCQFPAISCDDGDACTSDACEAGIGCVYTPAPCPGACCGISGGCTIVEESACVGFICDSNLYQQGNHGFGSCGNNPGGCCFGDIDGNGVVNAGDRGFVTASLGQTSPITLCVCDLDGNGVINAGDRGIISANIGQCTDLPPHMDGSGEDTRFAQPQFMGWGSDCTACP